MSKRKMNKEYDENILTSFVDVVHDHLKSDKIFCIEAISKIDDLDVYVEIYYNVKVKDVYLTITYSEVFDCDRDLDIDLETTINLDRYENDAGLGFYEVLGKNEFNLDQGRRVLEIINSVFFCKFSGKIFTGEKQRGEYIKKAKDKRNIEYLITNSRIKKKEPLCDQCVVCLDETMTKTPCLHCLCVECWSKIRNGPAKICPICRKIIQP